MMPVEGIGGESISNSEPLTAFTVGSPLFSCPTTVKAAMSVGGSLTEP